MTTPNTLTCSCGRSVKMAYGPQSRCKGNAVEDGIGCGAYLENPAGTRANPGHTPGRCIDCGAWGGRDHRGLGWNCGCAAE